MALYQLLTRNFTSRGKQEINIFAACLALALNVTPEHLPDPALRDSGAALANGLSYGTAALVLLIAFVRDSGTPSWRRCSSDRRRSARWRAGAPHGRAPTGGKAA